MSKDRSSPEKYTNLTALAMNAGCQAAELFDTRRMAAQLCFKKLLSVLAANVKPSSKLGQKHIRRCPQVPSSRLHLRDCQHPKGQWTSCQLSTWAELAMRGAGSVPLSVRCLKASTHRTSYARLQSVSACVAFFPVYKEGSMLVTHVLRGEPLCIS